MNGELIYIIMTFFSNFFGYEFGDRLMNDAGVTLDEITQFIFCVLFPKLGGYDSGIDYLESVWGLGSYSFPGYFLASICTIITLIFLIILLFKLFKWIFTLIFKLFRLN